MIFITPAWETHDEYPHWGVVCLVMNPDPTRESNPDSELPDEGADNTAVEDILEDLEELSESVPVGNAQETIRETQGLLVNAGERGLLYSGVRRLDLRDAAEALIGSVIFVSPLLVEGGVFDIATHLFETTYFEIPFFFIANILFVILLTHALLEWTGRDKAEATKIARIIPIRLVMILTVSFIVTAVSMTAWGRIENWQHITEAVARIMVLWTVASIGAALGDILSHESDAHTLIREETPLPDDRSVVVEAHAEASGFSDAELLVEIETKYEELGQIILQNSNKDHLEELRHRTNLATSDELFGRQIKKYTTRDVAEAFVGSIIFAIPLLVEDGVFDVASYFLSIQIGQFPVFFLINAVFVFFILWALIYWTGPQDVQINRPIFGVIPRRIVGIAVISFVTAAALMTMWGRVGQWSNPVVAVARISVVWSVAAFGAALGDILPGESSGADINDELADLTEFGDDANESHHDDNE